MRRMVTVMRNASVILILLMALVIGFLASVAVATASDAELAARDASTGPYNPNLPSPDALPRRGA